MAAIPESGFLLIADLTGYTAYLSSGEIEHAPTIAGDLLETIVGRLEPPFRLAKLEGDAAFMFVEDGRAEPSLLVDAIEACYVAFRRRLHSIEQATSCDCVSCSRAPRLDLKFFVHHGQYVRTRIAGRDEIAGSSIIVVHRLLKGASAAHATGARGGAVGFALFTGEALDAMGQAHADLGVDAGSEAIEHLGSVTTHTIDLESRWQAERDVRRLTIDAAEAAIDLEVRVDSGPAAIWANLTSPGLRPNWEGAIVISESPGAGRRGVGTTSQCVTGRLATIEEIVDWQPFEHVGYRLAVPEVGAVTATYDLVPDGDRTIVRLRWAPAGTVGVDARVIERIGWEKRDALERLARRLADASIGVEVPA